MMINFKINYFKNMEKFNLVWAGQFVSIIGTAMTKFALLIWAYQQTGKAATTAMFGFTALLPFVLLSPLAGMLVDRIDRKKVMIFADLGAGFGTIGIFILYSLNELQIWHLYLAEALAGACEAFQVPAYFSAITLLIPKDQYSRAHGMISLAHSTAQIAAPILAGILMPLITIRGVMIIDIITLSFAIAALIVVKIPNPEFRRDQSNNPRRYGEEFWIGLKFLMKNKGLFWLMLIFLNMNFLSGLTYFGILPAMILARSANNQLILASVQAALGAGGIAGSIIVSIWRGPKKKVPTIMMAGACSFLLGDLLLALGTTGALWIVAAFWSSFFIPFISAPCNVLWQTKVEPRIQGRVFSIRSMSQQAGLMLGFLLGGYLADNIFEPALTTNTAIKRSFEFLVGSGKGSGMALMFICTGILGALTCLSGYFIKEFRDLEETMPDYD
jgi:MFS family permease